MHPLIFYPDYRAANPYQALLYEQVDPVVAVEPGDIDAALRRLRATGRGARRVLFHLHWEDAVLRNAPDAAAARAAAQRFLASLERFADAGGLILWTKHNLVPHDFVHAALCAPLSAAISQLADAVIAHSPMATLAVAEHLRLDPARLALQLHGHYRARYAPMAQAEARRRLGLAPDRRILLLFGRITPYKGADALLAALAGHAGPPVDLLLVGKQPFAPTAIPAALAGRVTVLDRFVSDAETAAAFAAADGVALPYREILTSGTLLLALGSGRPVLIPRLPTLTEVASEAAAFAYDPAAPDGLAGALAAFARADAAALAAMGSTGEAIARAHDWRLAGRQLSDLIHGLLARRPVADRRAAQADAPPPVPAALPAALPDAAE